MQAHGTTPATPLLQVRDLQVRFGTKSVVRGVGFEIARGEKLALVGESGSGKTITALSLLRLAGDAAVEGQALFAGRDLLQLSEREMRGVRGGDIAMVFQEPMTALNPLMTIGQQIADRIADVINSREGIQVPRGALDITLYRDDLQTIGPRPVVGRTQLPLTLDGVSSPNV